VRTPIRVGFLLVPFSAVLLALAALLLLPSLALSGPQEAAAAPGAVSRGGKAPKDKAPAPVASRCKPLSGEAGDVCRDLVELEVRDVVPLERAETHAVLLVSKDGAQMLPIFVDEAAAVAIAFRLAHMAPPHPLAQDLLDEVVKGLGGTVREVRIDSLKDDVFVGRIVIDQAGKDHAMKARPSDSIAMALSGNAPILAHRQVLAEAGVNKEQLDSMMGELGVGGSGPPTGEGDEEMPGMPGMDPEEPLTPGSLPGSPKAPAEAKDTIRL
jgi:bifunctional DNase/RNase